ncbi:MAG: holo-ACP synthase [Deltaproteobacteria bacterium]|nr:holo-ACP synthase [Deltaproteobacteria bacterium]
MIHGIGIDIVHIPKFKKAVERWGDRFKNRIFTQHELMYCEKRKFYEQHLAARFAAKEAFLKAIGCVIQFADIEILNNPNGCPYIVLSKNPKYRIQNLKTHLTISHDGDYCIAQVILEKN